MKATSNAIPPVTVVEINEFAENVLFATNLETKLRRPVDIRSEMRGDERRDSPVAAGIESPRVPGRPDGLSLDRWHSEARIEFPNPTGLHKDEERALAIHFFANHELLAVELMALCLLKFPDAPAEFRHGVLQTLIEEQVHTELYIERMQQLGITFGQFPVNDFFWKCTAPMSSPIDFVAQMSLTFEQANLDYSKFYAETFNTLGDADTAKILERIHLDEIGHVSHGLKWFKHWQQPDESEWDAYRHTVKFPLTPSRAKGIGFQVEARQRAGLTDDFIAQLQVYSHSKGRTPNVYSFNPACEAEIAHGRPGLAAVKAVQQLAADLASLMMLVARRDDVVLVPRRPGPAFLAALQNVGCDIPEFVESTDDLRDRTLTSLQPWGWSPESRAQLTPLMPQLNDPRSAIDQRPTELFSKAWSAQLLQTWIDDRDRDDWICPAEVVGQSCVSMNDVEEQLTRIAEAGYETAVAKAIYGASGQNACRINEGTLADDQRRWVTRALSAQGAVVVEPWLTGLMDFSVHADIRHDNSLATAGITRFLTDGRGQYRGALIGRLVDGLEQDVVRGLYGGESRRLYRLYDDIFASVVNRLDTITPGPVGIDGLVYRHNDEVWLKPIVEINPRFTMGRLALSLNRRLRTGRAGVWLIINKRDVAAAGFAEFPDFAAAMQERYPVQCDDTGKTQISEGVLITNDPDHAQAYLSMLVVGRSLDACKSCFDDLPGPIGNWRQWC
jgi:uncharacterized ferritin-like protein (DUF455 family)